MSQMTYTWVPSDAHDAVKAYAAINRIKVPDAYARIIIEGLKAFSFNTDMINK